MRKRDVSSVPCKSHHAFMLYPEKLCTFLRASELLFLNLLCTVCPQHFQTETDDLDGLEWSPDGRVLCVWDSCLTVRFKSLCFLCACLFAVASNNI